MLLTSLQLSEMDRAVTVGVTTGATFGVKVAPVSLEADEVELAVKSALVSPIDAVAWVERASKPVNVKMCHFVTDGSAPGDGVALTTCDARPERLVRTLDCVEGQFDRGRSALQCVWCKQGQEIVDVERS